MTDGLLADQNLRLAQKMLDQQGEIAALKAQLAKVHELLYATDPIWTVPADGSVLLATYSGGYKRENLPLRERVWFRSDQEGCTDPDGDWFEFGDDRRCSYAEVLAHDDPACDRPVVTLEPLVFVHEVKRILAGLDGG